MGNRVKAFQQKQRLIGVFVVLYVVLAMIGNSFSPRGEYYPFFSWSLFSFVQHPSRNYHLEIMRMGDATFEEPRDYFTFRDDFGQARARSSDLGKSIGRLATLYLQDPKLGENYRPAFEKKFLNSDKSIKYRIVAITADAIKQYRTGEVLDRLVIAEFEVGKPR